MLEKALKIFDALNAYKVEYVVIGGYAIILHGFLRATEDVDIVLKMNEPNVLNFQKALMSIYNDPEINEISFEELQKYSVIRYGSKDNFYLDVISNIGESFNYENIEIVEKEVNGVVVKFASAKSLLKMKEKTNGEKDKIDVLFLTELQRND